MSNITAFADTFRDWEGLLGAIAENAARVPGTDPFTAALQATLEQAKATKLQQESLAGNRRALTDSFLHQVDQGKLEARKLRSFIVSVLGPRSPLLPLFGIPPKPERKINPTRRRKTASQQPTAKPPVETPAAGEAAAAAVAAEPAKPGF